MYNIFQKTPCIILDQPECNVCTMQWTEVNEQSERTNVRSNELNRSERAERANEMLNFWLKMFHFFKTNLNFFSQMLIFCSIFVHFLQFLLSFSLEKQEFPGFLFIFTANTFVFHCNERWSQY